MKKVMLALMIGSLGVVPILQADAAKRPKRVERLVSVAYDTPAVGVAGVAVGGNCASPNTGCSAIVVGPKERFLSVEITDASGLPATGAIWAGEAPESILLDTFCGITEEPVVVEPGTQVTVWAHVGPAPDNACPGVATSGSINSVLSNLP